MTCAPLTRKRLSPLYLRWIPMMKRARLIRYRQSAALKTPQSRHFFALRQAIGLLSHHLISTLFLLAFTCVLLVLPLTLMNLKQNVSIILENVTKNAVINVYLETSTGKTSINQLLKTLNLRKDVTFLRYISPKQGLNEFEQQSGVTHIMDYLPHNPIPGVIVLKASDVVNTPDMAKKLIDSLTHLPHVTRVVMNTEWLFHAYNLLTILNKTLLSFTGIVFLLVIVITTTLFHILLPRFPLKKPYLTLTYLGVMLGVISGTMADYLVNYTLLSLKDLLQQLTFIDASALQLDVSANSLLLNVVFAVFTMVLSGLIVHKYRVRAQ